MTRVSNRLCNLRDKGPTYSIWKTWNVGPTLVFFSPLNIKFKVSVVRFADPQNQIFDQILVSDKCHRQADRQTDRQTE